MTYAKNIKLTKVITDYFLIKNNLEELLLKSATGSKELFRDCFNEYEKCIQFHIKNEI